jgi:beta-glucosidase
MGAELSAQTWFAATGGWAREDAADRFRRYIDALTPVFDAGVVRVMTINEPNIVAVFPRLGPEGLGSGGLPVPDPDVTRIMIGVHQAAVAHLRDRHPQLEVGWGVSIQDYQPEPGAEADTEPIDDLAVPRTLTGWEYYPQALGGAVRRVSRVLPGTPIIVTENGLATADEAQRIEYTTGALLSLRAAMDDGADVRGYFHWSLLDNWECGRWEPTFGLIAVDRATFDRSPKPSLRWLGALAPRRS